MARYFFDVHDDERIQSDDDGQEFASDEAACLEARRLLPDIARDELVKDGDKRTYAVLVTDESGHPIYSATLTYTGIWLQRQKTQMLGGGTR